METSFMITGIGGQGIQLLSKSLALAATRDGREVMLSSEVGGEMRGGPSLASVVIGDDPVTALPILEACDVLVMAHHRFSERPCERLRDNGTLIANSSVVCPEQFPTAATVLAVPASEEAKALGASQTAGFVLLGALAQVTGIVTTDALAAAMTELLPAYRKQHAPANAAAIARGAELARNHMAAAPAGVAR